MLKVVECRSLPKSACENVVYCLLPNGWRADFYRQRTDRNIGWITREEQEYLRECTIGIAGCGGMGGFLAAVFLRLGVGEIRIADCEAFDVSNINRQFAARKRTVGRAKALETAREAHRITDDTRLVVYPQGITHETARPFAEGCSIIFDEIEFFAVGARILLHQETRRASVTVINCNTVGFMTFCFKFTAESMTVEEALGISCEEAVELERTLRMDPRSLTGMGAAEKIRERILRVFVPVLPEYADKEEQYRTREAFLRRLQTENRVSIIATNPVMASGFAANRGLLELLDQFGRVRRSVCVLPPMPGYLSFDALKMEAVSCNQQWW